MKRFSYFRHVSQEVEQHIVEVMAKDPKGAIPLIYDRYADALYGTLCQMLDSEVEAKDVLQQAFIKYWQKAGHYDASKAKLFTWLLNVARNTALDHLRKKGRLDAREIRGSFADVYTGESTTKTDTLDIKEHINGLSEKHRVVIDALYFKGFTQQEASEALNMPLGTVKTRLRNALKELRTVYNTGTLALILFLGL